MKRNTLYTFGIVLLATLSLNSCELMEVLEAHNQELAIQPRNQSEKLALTYIQTIDNFNDVCDDLSARKLTQSQATFMLKNLTNRFVQLDNQVWASPVMNIVTGSKYGASYERVKEKVGANMGKFGVREGSEDYDKNTPLQRAMYDFGCSVYHAG